MNRIILWYNANRKSIWKIIGVVVIVIIVIQLFRYLWKQNEIIQGNKVLKNTNDNTQIILNSIGLQDKESVITGEKISNGQVNLLEVLDTFVDYCNNNQITKAYNLLSEDCKNEMYPTEESFKKGYYNTIFLGKKRNITVENWTKNIYKVKYMEDALSTGIYTTENAIQDYITIKSDEQGNIKLNINSFIGKQDIDIEKEVYGIKVKVIEKHTYMDYETYTFEITNNSNNIILINDSNNTESMYLQDTNELKYTAYTHELSETELKLALKETKKVTIKYYNKYSSSKRIKNIVFDKVILNYSAYANYQNPGYYRNYGTIQISL